MSATYPTRGCSFTLNFFRALHRNIHCKCDTCFGDSRDLCYFLLTEVALAEMARYHKEPPRFWRRSFLQRVGRLQHQSERAIAICVSTGWLHWEPIRHGQVLAWVLIPEPKDRGNDSMATADLGGRFTSPPPESNGDAPADRWMTLFADIQERLQRIETRLHQRKC